MRGIGRALTLVVAGLALAAPARAERITMADALAMAYTTNPELEAARAKVRAADDAVAEARSGWRPSASVSGTYGWSRTEIPTAKTTLPLTPMTGRAVMSQPVVTGGQAHAQVQRAIAQVRSARADLLNAEQQILLAAATAYMDVVRDAQGLRLHQTDVNVLTRQRDATKTQLDAGAATKTDLQEVEVRIAGAEADLAGARAQLAQSRHSFERIIGRPSETLEEMPPMLHLPGTIEQAMAMGLKLSPRIQGAQADDKAAQYGVDNAVGAMLPHANIVAEYDYVQDSLNSGFGTRAKVDTLSVLGQVQIPLYSGGAETARIREAKEARSQTRLGIYDADMATRQNVKDTWANYHAAQEAVGHNTRRVGASEDALNGVIQQQHQGERQILDILNAEQERLAAQLALAGSRHDMVVASYQLVASTGQLTAKDLGLKVKLYDPNEHYDAHSSSWLDFGDSDQE
ncbi:MAG TPA: TolC family outer membrane protein [Rhizomicrobium sp.]|nr:TolC family outer membrane protein [Rhizomicrobium sp.]